MFHALEAYDVDCSPWHMGFRKTYSCAELVAMMRLVLDRRQEWGLPTRIAQIDFARAYDSVRHAAIYRSMKKRGVPEPLALAYLREARRAHMRFRHATWSTDPIRAGVGLRQGCSPSPMLFRWVLQDCLEPLHEEWTRNGRGVSLDSRTLTHVAWADDTWLLDATRAGLESMLRDVATRADLETGLVLRWDKCSVAEVVHRDARHKETEPPLEEFPHLAQTSLVADGTCMRLLGAVVQVGHEYTDEWNTIRKKCWKAFHARTKFWRVKMQACHKIRMLQMAVFPVLNWCSASRYWNRAELASVRTMQLRMGRRALNLWPQPHEEFHQFLRRSARWIDNLLQAAKAPRWDVAVAASWWRYAGHIARVAKREPDRWVAQALQWRDASYRQAVRALHWSKSDPERQRLGRALKGCTARRWDDPLQSTCNKHLGREEPWQSIAQDKNVWASLEESFVNARLGIKNSLRAPPGRWMLGDSPI